MQLGLYDAEKAVKLAHQGKGVWCVELDVLPDTTIEYRYLVRDTRSRKTISESNIFRRVCLVSAVADAAPSPALLVRCRRSSTCVRHASLRVGASRTALSCSDRGIQR
jgi:hypothetical protein